jgi:hypothetical protein
VAVDDRAEQLPFLAGESHHLHLFDRIEISGRGLDADSREAGPLYGMMLPTLISVSVTPVSYFFCATADTEAAAMISPESPSVVISVLMKSLAQRFMNFLLG